MKKRILALALAGTTAFSVFGAAVSANAASTHVVYANDAYASYQPASVTVDSTKVTEKDGAYVVVKQNAYTKEHPEALADVTGVKALADVQKESDNVTSAMKALYTPVTTLYVTSDADGVSVTGINNGGTEVTGFNGSYYTDAAGVVYYAGALNTDDKAKLIAATTGTAFAGDQLVNADEDVNNWIADNLQYRELYSKEKSSKYTEYAAGALTNYGNGTISDAELSRDGETIDHDTVYAYDYFDKSNAVDNFVEAFESANWKRADGSRTFINTAGYGAALYNIVLNGKNNTSLDNLAVNDGFYTYNGSRANVLDEYLDFLGELGLIEYRTVNKVAATGLTQAAFLSGYDYLYKDPVTGKQTDLYKFKGLVSDIYATVDEVVEAYNDRTTVDYTSSNLVYIMQQYDKYTGEGYVPDASDNVGENNWAELLISAINAVDEGDFTTSVAYNTYKRAGDKAIAAYEAATTTAAQNAAIAGLYTAATSSYGRSAGADKAELTSTLNSLYFNNKSIPNIYMPEVDNETSVADLVLYGYGKVNEYDVASIKKAGSTVKPVYPLYPVADYTTNGSTKAATYIGNNGSINAATTDEYEWFWNVYQLATTVNAQSKAGSYQGVIDTVNSALANAAEDLTAYTPARASTALRLEEAVDEYDGKVESDYVAKYWNAYNKASKFADKAEGNMQTKYAIEMMVISGETLGYQSSQTTITKTDINGLKASIKNGQAAVKAIKDSDKYNAVQVSALNNAIAKAQNIVDTYNGVKDNKTTVNKVSTDNKVGDKDQIVKSDVTGAIEAIDAAIKGGSVIQGWSKNSDGKWQYGTKDSYLSNGWNKIGATWYYFNADGTAKQSEWFQENGKWYYFNSNCGAAYNWCKVDGNWYYFNGDNAMRTGWLKKEGSWYYLASSGKMVTGWTQIDGKWYYFSKESNSLGQMAANTTVDGYKVNADGVWVK